MQHGTRARLVAALLFGGIAAACTNPVGTSTHVSPNGFDLVIGEDAVVTETGGTLTGTLQLAAGQDRGPVTVRFRDGANVVTPGSDYFLEISFANDADAVARFTATSNGAFTGTLRGLAAGTTTLRVRLMHGRFGSPRAHHDYQSAPVTVVVTAPVASRA